MMIGTIERDIVSVPKNVNSEMNAANRGIVKITPDLKTATETKVETEAEIEAVNDAENDMMTGKGTTG